nr:defensin SD2-like isoform X2 [Erigeron canadensis]
MANEMGGPMVVEGRTCESASHRFKGPCLSKSNCASVCKTEGFPAGHCRGLRRRCFCVKHC